MKHFGTLPLLLGLCLAADSAPQRAELPLAKPAGKLLAWLPTLAEGRALAQRLRQPILVKVGGPACPWCKRLDEAIAHRKVQEELSRWVLVAVEVDAAAPDLRTLAVGPIPALRVLTPAGRVVAAHDGYLPEDKLLAWLKQHHEAGAAAPLAELASKEPPGALALVRLIGELKQRDPVVREAAVRRLGPHADLAAAPVVESFLKGPLQARLGTLELLQLWQAPVAELDPWRPDTLTEARRKALQAWALSPGKIPLEKLFELTDVQRAEARQEIARLLHAADADALALRERLARFGRGLLPEVHARLKEAATDQARERLTALRYRLVAADALVLHWPGGLERLAATAAATRHQAVQELAQRASADEEPLLLELFSDPDPLVRELSLRALHGIAGSRATEALTALLRDPEPNVRAAVLKQLTEEPTPGMVPKLAEYVTGEKDADLVVHVARALRATKSKAGFEALKGLLSHESWRVRAEVAEALKESTNRHDLPDKDRLALQADAYATFIKLLDDPDGFVVGRAIIGLKGADLTAAVVPLVRVVPRHPELAAEAVRALAYSHTMRNAAVGHFRKFASHPDPEVRAAAIEGLCEAEPDEVEHDLRAALRDPTSTVRRAAAHMVYQLCDRKRPQPGQSAGSVTGRRASNSERGVLAYLQALLNADRAAVAAAESQEHGDAWLHAFRAGKQRPTWWLGLIELLQPMLAAEVPEERLAAALPLIALARENLALPVLLTVAKNMPALQSRAAQALSWLPWSKRLDLFLELTALRPSPEQRAVIPQELTRYWDTRTIPLLWEMAAEEDVKGELADALLRGLLEVYLRVPYHDRRQATVADRKAAAAVARTRAAAGPRSQRLLALALLAAVDKDAAPEAARTVMDDAAASPELRRDALQVLLACQDKRESVRTALASLKSQEPLFRKLAAMLLAVGGGSLSYLTDAEFYLSIDNQDPYSPGLATANQPFTAEPPRGLTPELVRPLLKDPDPRTVAYAGYLLALLGEADGLEPLVRYWREHARTEDEWQALVARGITLLGEDEHVRILEEVYRALPRDRGMQYRVRDFYWTIRGLDGPNALRLRKVIRQEVGMENLK